MNHFHFLLKPNNLLIFKSFNEDCLNKPVMLLFDCCFTFSLVTIFGYNF